MITLVATVFVASLLGSLHCAACVGPLWPLPLGSQAMASHGSRCKRPITEDDWQLTCSWAPRRVASALVDMTSTLAGLQPVAMALAGGLMIALGVTELLRHFGHRIAHVAPPKLLVQTVQRGQRLCSSFNPRSGR